MNFFPFFKKKNINHINRSKALQRFIDKSEKGYEFFYLKNADKQNKLLEQFNSLTCEDLLTSPETIQFLMKNFRSKENNLFELFETTEIFNLFMQKDSDILNYSYFFQHYFLSLHNKPDSATKKNKILGHILDVMLSTWERNVTNGLILHNYLDLDNFIITPFADLENLVKLERNLKYIHKHNQSAFKENYFRSSLSGSGLFLQNNFFHKYIKLFRYKTVDKADLHSEISNIFNSTVYFYTHDLISYKQMENCLNNCLDYIKKTDSINEFLTTAQINEFCFNINNHALPFLENHGVYSIYTEKSLDLNKKRHPDIFKIIKNNDEVIYNKISHIVYNDYQYYKRTEVKDSIILEVLLLPISLLYKKLKDSNHNEFYSYMIDVLNKINNMEDFSMVEQSFPNKHDFIDWLTSASFSKEKDKSILDEDKKILLNNYVQSRILEMEDQQSAFLFSIQFLKQQPQSIGNDLIVENIVKYSLFNKDQSISNNYHLLEKNITDPVVKNLFIYMLNKYDIPADKEDPFTVIGSRIEKSILKKVYMKEQHKPILKTKRL